MSKLALRQSQFPSPHLELLCSHQFFPLTTRSRAQQFLYLQNISIAHSNCLFAGIIKSAYKINTQACRNAEACAEKCNICKSIISQRERAGAAMHSTREQCISVECTRQRKLKAKDKYVRSQANALWRKKTTLGKITPSAEQLCSWAKKVFSQQRRNWWCELSWKMNKMCHRGSRGQENSALTLQSHGR